MEDLAFAINDRPVVRMARVLGSEVRPWLERALFAVRAGVPLNPQLKRQLLHELYDMTYEPFHAVGKVIFISSAPNNYGWPGDTQILMREEPGRKTQGVPIPSSCHSD